MMKLELKMNAVKVAMSRYKTDLWDPEYLEETCQRVLSEIKDGKYVEKHREKLGV